jgi:hypothetical protein
MWTWQQPPSRKYRAKGLTPKGPAELTFHNAQGDKEMTVAEYYEQQYQILYVETKLSSPEA